MAEFWTGALAITLFLYVMLDGIDLGVGVLFGLERHDETRRQLLRSVSPVWDGNETWLVLSAAILFGAFPIVYSLLLSAFYLPMIAMLGGLILRGVAFEFREYGTWSRGVWDAGFIGGSVVAALVQGCAVGALVLGLPNVAGRFTGGPFFWLQPFALLCGAGLLLGYTMLGAAWIIRKTEGEVQQRTIRKFRILLAAFLLCLAAIFVWSLMLELPMRDRWAAHPLLMLVPFAGLIGAIIAFAGPIRGRDGWPLVGGMLLFAATFATLAASFLPYIVPYSLTYADAAAPAASLSFLFWFAGIVALPLTIIYGIVNFMTFRGKLSQEDEGDY